MDEEIDPSLTGLLRGEDEVTAILLHTWPVVLFCLFLGFLVAGVLYNFGAHSVTTHYK